MDYKQEIPKSRINIEVAVKTNDGMQVVELPLKLLLLGKFSGKNDSIPLKQREPLPVNMNNLEKVIGSIAPKLQLSVVNKLDPEQENLAVNCKINSLKDFHPDNIVQNIPELKSLVAKRNLLAELKNNLMHNNEMRQYVEDLLQSPRMRRMASEELIRLTQKN